LKQNNSSTFFVYGKVMYDGEKLT